MTIHDVRDLCNDVPIDTKAADRLATICGYLCDEIEKLQGEIDTVRKSVNKTTNDVYKPMRCG